MDFKVHFTGGARKDLRAIHTYIAANDCVENADYVAREIVRVALTLRSLPKRGTHPPELLRKGNRSYRQIFFKPYRVIYRIQGSNVFIALIADGRRKMVPLLMRRLPPG